MLRKRRKEAEKGGGERKRREEEKKETGERETPCRTLMEKAAITMAK
jgi:hypothetical protein